MLRLLILGGSSEASALCRALEGDPRVEATLSLAGVTRAPSLPRLAVRIGGFGGVDGLAGWLRASRTDALIDATHPFAQRISRNAMAACAAAGVPMLRIARPPWLPADGDCWIPVPDMAAAALALGRAPRRVLLTIGRKDLAPFVGAPQHDYLVRSVDAPPPELLPPRAETLTARGPFALADELALLRRHRIGIVVTKNSGGEATRPKLEAARALGLAVVMVARPEPVPAPHGPDWQAGLAWLDALHQASATPRAV